MTEFLILMLVFANALANREDKTLGISETNAAISCDEIYQRNPISKFPQLFPTTEARISSYGTWTVTCTTICMIVVATYSNSVDPCMTTW